MSDKFHVATKLAATVLVLSLVSVTDTTDHIHQEKYEYVIQDQTPSGFTLSAGIQRYVLGDSGKRRFDG